jgi:hypothetical protein
MPRYAGNWWVAGIFIVVLYSTRNNDEAGESHAIAVNFNEMIINGARRLLYIYIPPTSLKPHATPSDNRQRAPVALTLKNFLEVLTVSFFGPMPRKIKKVWQLRSNVSVEEVKRHVPDLYAPRAHLVGTRVVFHWMDGVDIDDDEEEDCDDGEDQKHLVGEGTVVGCKLVDGHAKYTVQYYEDGEFKARDFNELQILQTWDVTNEQQY